MGDRKLVAATVLAHDVCRDVRLSALMQPETFKAWLDTVCRLMPANDCAPGIGSCVGCSSVLPEPDCLRGEPPPPGFCTACGEPPVRPRRWSRPLIGAVGAL